MRIIENLLKEREHKIISDFLLHGRWKFGWKSHKATDVYSFWHRHFAGHLGDRKKYDCADELRKNAPIIFGLWTALSKTEFKDHTLIRCYANAHMYGIDGTIHTDSRSDRSYTAIYYPHHEWDPNWAGETVLFNDDRSDIIASIYPKPNRLAIFNGNIPHLARGVSRTCPVLRVTLMFKTLGGGLDQGRVQEIPDGEDQG